MQRRPGRLLPRLRPNRPPSWTPPAGSRVGPAASGPATSEEKPPPWWTRGAAAMVGAGAGLAGALPRARPIPGEVARDGSPRREAAGGRAPPSGRLRGLAPSSRGHHSFPAPLAPSPAPPPPPAAARVRAAEPWSAPAEPANHEPRPPGPAPIRPAAAAPGPVRRRAVGSRTKHIRPRRPS